MEHFQTLEEHEQQELLPKSTDPSHTPQNQKGILTFILVLPIKAMAAMMLFPVFCQNVSASSSMLGLKVIFWPRK